MWCYVAERIVPDFSRNRSAFIFRIRLLDPEDEGVVILTSIWNSSPQLRHHILDNLDHRLFHCRAWKCADTFPSDKPKIYSLCLFFKMYRCRIGHFLTLLCFYPFLWQRDCKCIAQSFVIFCSRCKILVHYIRRAGWRRMVSFIL